MCMQPRREATLKACPIMIDRILLSLEVCTDQFTRTHDFREASVIMSHDVVHGHHREASSKACPVTACRRYTLRRVLFFERVALLASAFPHHVHHV
jgi:hypothetical protein